jgi:hypothetical protein
MSAVAQQTAFQVQNYQESDIGFFAFTGSVLVVFNKEQSICSL